MNELQTKPKVGNGAYISYGMDCHSVTIVEVWNDGKNITVQRDFVYPTFGAAPYSNDWDMKPNENGALYYFTLRKNGRYVAKGAAMNSGSVLHLSGRYEYFSYEF